MSARGLVVDTWLDFLTALQFLTRIPVSAVSYRPDSLARSVRFFPVVGLLIGSAAAVLHQVLAPHLPRPAAALLVLVFLVGITGCLHEDGLADTADAFGGGWNREQVLLILKDSRIGTYGGTALVFSLVGRWLMIASLPLSQVPAYLIAGHVLCRWTTLPLSYFLPSARTETEPAGQGARLAQLTTLNSLTFGSCVTVSVMIYLLRIRALPVIIAAGLITLLTGLLYRRKIGGVTGDCFGATNQLTELTVYLAGVWIA